MKKKKKEPISKPNLEEEEEGSLEELEEEELARSYEELKSEKEEAEPATPLPEKKKLKTRTSDPRKSTPIFKTLISLKRPTKTPKKWKSCQKKPKIK